MRISKLYMTLAVLAVTGCSGHKAGLPLVQMEEVAENGAVSQVWLFPYVRCSSQ